jgi:hypothetical protein
VERVLFSVTRNALLPASDEARAVMAKLSIGDNVGVEIYQERHTKFSNYVQMVFERIGKALHYRVRNVRGWIAAETGRADVVKIAGKQVLVAHGTGQRDMSAAEFEAFWEDAKDVIKQEIVPTLPVRDAEDILTMIKEN